MFPSASPHSCCENIQNTQPTTSHPFVLLCEGQVHGPICACRTVSSKLLLLWYGHFEFVSIDKHNNMTMLSKCSFFGIIYAPSTVESLSPYSASSCPVIIIIHRLTSLHRFSHPMQRSTSRSQPREEELKKKNISLLAVDINFESVFD